MPGSHMGGSRGINMNCKKHSALAVRVDHIRDRRGKLSRSAITLQHNWCSLYRPYIGQLPQDEKCWEIA